MTRRRSECGTAIVEFVWLGLILLVPLLYIVLSVFEVQRTAYATSAAARSAGRAFLTAPDAASAQSRAQAAAALAFADQGLDSAARRVRIDCQPDPGNCLTPGSTVTVVVDSAAVLPFMPSLLGDGAPRVAVSSEHAAPYGTFREAR